MTDDSDQTIDDALRAAFRPPDASRFRELAEAAQGASAPTISPARPRRLGPWLAAAAAAILAALWLLDHRPLGPQGHDGKELGALWAAAYEHAVASGFGSMGCCQTPFDVTSKCEEICGVPLQFDDDEDIALLGCYSGLSTGGCLGLLLEVSGAPVAVFVVPVDSDPIPALSHENLQINRRQLGDLAIYAISQRRTVDTAVAAPPAALHRFSL